MSVKRHQDQCGQNCSGCAILRGPWMVHILGHPGQEKADSFDGVPCQKVARVFARVFHKSPACHPGRAFTGIHVDPSRRVIEGRMNSDPPRIFPLRDFEAERVFREEAKNPPPAPHWLWRERYYDRW